MNLSSRMLHHILLNMYVAKKPRIIIIVSLCFYKFYLLHVNRVQIVGSRLGRGGVRAAVVCFGSCKAAGGFVIF